MGKESKKSSKSSPRQTPEGQESLLINLAMSLAEKKLKNGTASSQLITHFLKLATLRYQLENDKLRSDLEVANAKIRQIDSQEEIKKLYEDAISAMKTYSGMQMEEEHYDEY